MMTTKGGLTYDCIALGISSDPNAESSLADDYLPLSQATWPVLPKVSARKYPKGSTIRTVVKVSGCDRNVFILFYVTPLILSDPSALQAIYAEMLSEEIDCLMTPICDTED